jgi:hypothetical protein
LTPDELPGAAMFGPFGGAAIVVDKPLVEIGRHPNVEATPHVLDYVYPSHAALGLVAGAGFEPAIRPRPDYEPDGRLKPSSL